MDREGDNEVLRSARHLLSLLTQERADGSSTSQGINRSSHVRGQTPGPSSVQTEMTRSFPGLFSNRRGKRRFTGPCPVPIKPKPFQVMFHLLPAQCERSPSGPDQLLHTQAGLGRRTATLDESMTHQELCDKLMELYPKLGEVTGGWLLYKAAGGWGSRKLSLVAPADCGYTGRLIKTSKIGENSVIYIAPLQDELDVTPLPPSSEAFRDMPKAMCKKCKILYPLQILTNHIKTCSDVVVVEDGDESQDETLHDAQDVESEKKSNEQACCPICQEEMPLDILEVHASECGERSMDDENNNTTELSCMDNEVNDTAEFLYVDNDWKTHPDPKVSMALYRREILRLHETGKPILMCMDLRTCAEEQERQLINFYKQRNVEWACPVKCQLEGDAAVGDGVTRHFFSTILEKLKYGFSLNLGNTGVTCLFEGQPDHLVPSSSQFLIESDLFLVAGRMLGHSFLHGGPCLAGLSRAFVHVLLQGSQDTATLQLEDCPDVDIRETINLLSGQSPLNEDQSSKVLELCLSWDLPGPTEENRRWLYERLLSHAVIGRRVRQIKQLKRGLKDTFVWPLLTERKDVVFFPKESEDSCTPEMLLSHISWPRESDDEDDDEYSADIKERITGYLKQFIETASSKDLKNLLKFWVGWEQMEANMAVEIVTSDLPKSSTCFCILRLPGHYNSFQSFTKDLMMCIGTCKYGFGHV
ncbi:uncharacterized protein LOC127979271 isoform X2 [Carassius gibelio]|uniref:uncharacterized protein LOC127979271 isoform X2 n=1 Tax=Carassius gibelio TaxID=101364 RepID=UPI002277B59C|nr:uncharacterized protein LOC127979271 isoform X2 [Carassius gibelio]